MRSALPYPLDGQVNIRPSCYTPSCWKLKQACERSLCVVLRRLPPTAHVCSRLFKDECLSLGLRLTAAQAGRVQDAVSAGAYQFGDLLRDFRNRMSDEIEYKMPDNLALADQRHLTAGAAR